MSPAIAEDLAQCSSRDCGSLKRSALLAWRGRWPLIRPRSAATGRAAAAVGGDRGLTRCGRVRRSSSGLRPGGRGQVAWLQPLAERCGAEMWSSYAAWWQHSSPLGSRRPPRKFVCLSALHGFQRATKRRAMPSAGSIATARWHRGSRIDSLFSGAYRQVGGGYGRSYAVTWRHNSNRKLRTDAFKSPLFSRLRDSGTRAFRSTYAATWQHSCRDAAEGTRLSSVFSVVPRRLGSKCQMVFDCSRQSNQRFCGAKIGESQ